MKPVSCVDPSGKGSYGGSQMWWADKVLINSGCGIVAGFDSFLHMKGIEEIDKESYIEQITEAAKFIKPLRLPFWKREIKAFGLDFVGSFGVTLPRLKRGLRKFMKTKGIDVRVRSYRFNYIEKTRALLARDIPVILLVRAPFWNVAMYDETGSKKMDSLGMHYVTITDYDDALGMFSVSSWGRQYKIAARDLKKFSVLVRFCWCERSEP